MKLLELDLIAFGPFTRVVLDLSGGSEGLHLLYGPNEAGKSSALRAVRQFFTGIPHTSDDNFVHKNQDLRIGVRLRSTGGAVFEFRRRKGRQNTLLGHNDAPIDEGQLHTCLGSLKPDDVASRFALGHNELVAGGKAVIAGGGDIGQLLFVAGTSLVGLAGVQKRLEDECEALFKRAGSKPKINATWAELEDVRKARANAVLRGSDWLEHVELLGHTRESKRTIEETLDSARLTARRYGRLEQALEPIARRKRLIGERGSLTGAVLLPEEFTADRREAISKLEPAELTKTNAMRSLEAIDRELQTLHVPNTLLEQAEVIEQLHLRLGRYQQSAHDRSQMAVERDQLHAEARSIQRDLRLEHTEQLSDSTSTPERTAFATRPLTVDERVLIQDLGNDRQVVLKARDDARKALDKHVARLTDLSEKIRTLGLAQDAAGLRRAIAQAQRQGELEESVRTDWPLLERDEQRAATSLNTLGLWSGTLEDLEHLAIPAVETSERFQAELDGMTRAIEDLQSRLNDLDAQGRQLDARIEQLQLEREVPTEANLEQIRKDRDASWVLVKQSWSKGPEAAEVRTFEHDIVSADDTADRLRREADRVATKTNLLVERGRSAKSLGDLRGGLGEATTRLAEIEKRWQATWIQSGINPLSPREMLAWTRKALELAMLARTLRERRVQLVQREQKVVQLGKDLSTALVELGAKAQTTSESLSNLIARSQELVDSLADASSLRRRLEKDLATLEVEHPGLEDRVRTTQAELESWQSRWGTMMQRLGLLTDATPAQANAVLGCVSDLFDRMDKAEALQERIQAIDHEAILFSGDVRALATRVAPDLVQIPVEQAAAEFNTRLARARIAQERYTSLVERREYVVTAAEEAQATIDIMTTRLTSLCRLACCDHVDQLPAIEEQSRRRREIEMELADVERQLSLLGGDSLDAFIKEAETKDPDILALEISRQNQEIMRLEHERGVHDQTIGREEEILKQLDSTAGATDAEQDAENLRTRIRADIEEYTRLRLASAVLREGIERYRLKRQGPIVNRAGALFAALTLGSFERLAVDYNEKDEPVLKGVRPGGEVVGVEGMSLGTADQLYLALKLASLETYLDKGEPVPFVVDDILIHFDDERATAALRVLGELSKRTQILLFTHHRRLVELANSHLDPAILFTHTLTAPGLA